MEERDARTLTQDAQEKLRRRAIRRLKAGVRQVDVARELDVSRETVNRWWKRYQGGDGWDALKKRKRGRSPGSQRKLTAEQELEVRKAIAEKTPDQLKLKYALWTREAVGRFIRERYGVVYARQSLSEVLKRWGFTGSSWITVGAC